MGEYLYRHPRLLVVLALTVLVCVVGVSLARTRVVPVAADTYAALNVGQGDATLLQFAHGSLLIDAGPDASILPELSLLLSKQRTTPLLGLVTHAEKDHAYGFVPLLRERPLAALLWNGYQDHATSSTFWRLQEAARARNIPLVRVSAGDLIRFGTRTVTVLSPAPSYVGSAAQNDGSIVLRAETPSWRALLTGDIDAALEAWLLARYTPETLRADILKVAHHGSKTGSTEAFLDAIAPAVATVSSGARNTYGHPAPVVLDRLAARGIPVLRTDTLGTFTIERAISELAVRTFAN